jgi:hypothetical protein
MTSLLTGLRQVTTGHGIAVLIGALVAVLSGTMTWPVFIPTAVGALVLMIWPNNQALQAAAMQIAKDSEIAVAAIQNPKQETT